MKASTRAQLLALSREFYDQHASSFDSTRQHPWPGWERLIPAVPQAERLRVLDAGCGNGRFGLFLQSQRGGRIDFHGVDADPSLLASAARQLENVLDSVTLEQADLGAWIAQPPRKSFDLISLFGVLHHIPGNAQRLKLLHELAKLVAPGGLLVATWWMLHEAPTFERKKVPWTSSYGLDLEDLEPGDFLLGWKGDAQSPRYCHFPPPEELATSTQLPGLVLESSFRSDGSNRDNLYRVYRRSC